MRRLAMMLASVALLACGGGGDSPAAPAPFNPSGTWTGAAGGVGMTMTLVVSAGTVTGSGQMSQVGGSPIAQTISGTYVEPNMSLTLSAQGYQAINYAGPILNKAQFLGIMNGSGFVSQALTLSKQ